MKENEKKVSTSEDAKKEFLRLFKELCDSRSSWQVWADLMSVFACAISNSTEPDPVRREAREKEYAKCIEQLGGMEIPSKMFALLTLALSRKPEQDFLGDMFMSLNLGNHWKGQFFTPYHICDFMAKITLADHRAEIEEKGYISINDPACGAGATLIAAANVLDLNGCNHQTQALFVGQDLDRLAGLMCYIQLSVLECAGYVVIANTLTNPTVGDVLFPAEQEGQEYWYTPMFYNDNWTIRRAIRWMEFLALKK